MNLYNKSLERYKYKRQENVSYTKNMHLKWADVNNYGMTHFGEHPSKLHYDNIRFDTLYMICQITKNHGIHEKVYVALSAWFPCVIAPPRRGLSDSQIA